jgi:hypothetical protein
MLNHGGMESGSGWPDDPFDTSYPTPVTRQGEVVQRPVGPWTPTVQALLRHLHAAGFGGCPQVVGDGFDDQGNEVLTWIDGEVIHGRPWDEPEAVLWETGQMLRALHRTAASFVPPSDARWMGWTLHRDGPGTIVSHCNVAPWHIVIRDGRPAGFIGWEYAGPADPLEEIAATGWYCAQLHDDDVAEREGLPGAQARARWLKAFLDGCQVSRRDRSGLITRMIEFAVRDTAAFARRRGITPESTDPEPLWLLSWQIRGADWMLTHRDLLESIIQE